MIPAASKAVATDVNWTFTDTMPTAQQLDWVRTTCGLTRPMRRATPATRALRSKLLPEDQEKPTVLISSPSANQKVSAAAFAAGALTGTASDNVGVSTVKIRLLRKTPTMCSTTGTAARVHHQLRLVDAKLEDGNWVLDTQAPPADKLDSGSYSAQAYATDAAGNPPRQRQSRFHHRQRLRRSQCGHQHPHAHESIDINASLQTSLRALANAPTGVSAVKVKLVRSRNGVLEFWNGTEFVLTPTLISATLNTPNQPGTNWGLGREAPTSSDLDAGIYSVFRLFLRCRRQPQRLDPVAPLQ
jgi:hypothetical protein